MSQQVLTGEALSQFNAKYQELEETAGNDEETEWVENDKKFQIWLHLVTKKVFPKLALQTSAPEKIHATLNSETSGDEDL